MDGSQRSGVPRAMGCRQYKRENREPTKGQKKGSQSNDCSPKNTGFFATAEMRYLLVSSTRAKEAARSIAPVLTDRQR